MAAQETLEQPGSGFHLARPFEADIAINNKLATMSRAETLGETAALASGTVVYSFFTARQSHRDLNRIAFFAAGTAAATVTTIKYGLYEVNPDTLALSLVAITANTATALTAVDTAYPVATTASFNVKAGKRYAAAVIFVGTTPPTLLGRPALGANFNVVAGAVFQEVPRRSAQFAAQTDLSASIAAGSQAASETLAYAQVYQA